MDIASFIGIFGGIAVVMFGAFMGSSLGGLIDVPSMFITIGGSYMCLFLTYPLSYVIGIFKVMGRVFKVADYKEKEMVQNSSPCPKKPPYRSFGSGRRNSGF